MRGLGLKFLSFLNGFLTDTDFECCRAPISSTCHGRQKTRIIGDLIRSYLLKETSLCENVLPLVEGVNGNYLFVKLNVLNMCLRIGAI